jgi:hypothetical protein
MWGRIVGTLLFAGFVTVVLSAIENKSYVPDWIAIPALAALLTKYCLGDWDKGFQWSSLDGLYWASLLAVSYVTWYALSFAPKRV